MNILFVSHWYPNSQFHLRGIFVKQHAAAVKMAGVNVKVLAFSINPSMRWWDNQSKHFTDENGVDTMLIEVNAKLYKILMVDLIFHRIFMDKYYQKAFAGFIPHVVHSHVLFPAGIWGDRLAKKFGVPHVITEHWSKANEYLEKGLYKGKARRVMRDAAAILPVSGFLSKKMLAHAQERKFHIIPNVVDTAKFFYKGEKIREENELVFTSVGNWEGPKRPDLIFEALEVFSKKNKQKIRLHCFGQGSLITQIRDKIWNFEVKFYDFKESDRIPEVLAQTDFFVHASGLETFCIVVAEAACCGVPVIASNKGAIPEIINESNGILTENSVEEWVRSLEDIVEKKFDRKKISEEMISKVSMKNVGERMMKIYAQIAKGINS